MLPGDSIRQTPALLGQRNFRGQLEVDNRIDLVFDLLVTVGIFVAHRLAELAQIGFHQLHGVLLNPDASIDEVFGNVIGQALEIGGIVLDALDAPLGQLALGLLPFLQARQLQLVLRLFLLGDLCLGSGLFGTPLLGLFGTVSGMITAFDVIVAKGAKVTPGT